MFYCSYLGVPEVGGCIVAELTQLKSDDFSHRGVRLMVQDLYSS